MSKTTKNLVDAMRAATEKKTSAYDTRGTVTRIEDGVAWVHIPGGVDETPVKLTINAKAGDTVQVRVGGGGAFLVGNATAPPTDDARANEAFRYANSAAEASAAAQKSAATASEAAAQAVSDAATAQSAAETAQNSLRSVVSGATTVEKAVSVMQTALEAVVDYDPQTDTTKEYFWHDANGAHVLGTSGDYRNDIDSSGMKIVETATEESVAEFGVSVARIGRDNKSRFEIDTNSITGYNEDSVKYFDIDMSSGTKTETYRIGKMFSNVAQVSLLPDDGSLVRLDSTTFSLDDISTAIGTTVNVSEFQLGISSGFDGTVGSTTNCNAYIQSYRTYNMIRVEPNISSITIGTGLQRVAEAYIDLLSVYNYTLYVRIEFVYDASTNEITITTFAKDVNQSGNVSFGSARGYFTIENSVTTTAPVTTLGTRDDTTPGAYSAAIGEHLITPYEDMVAVGKFNSDARIAQDADLLFAVGNGGADSSRSNAFAVDEYGRVHAGWSIYADGDMYASNGQSLYKSYALESGDSISSGANLNDYRDPGNYYCLRSADAATLTNCPVNTAFTLKVENGTGIDNTSGGNQAFYRSQIIRPYDNPALTYARRAWTSDGGVSWSWSNWRAGNIVNVITNSKSNVSIPKTTYTNLGQVTLPAYGSFLVFGEGGCGAASNGTYFSLSTYTVSGSPTVAWPGTQQAPTNGGGQCSLVGYYVTGSASAVIGLRGYMYGNGTTSGGWGQIVVVRLA